MPRPWVFLLFGLIFFLAWRPLFWGAKVPVNGNVMREVYPNWVVTHSFLREGRLPLWNPYKNMGEPHGADPKTLAAYPLSWLLAFLAPSFLGFMRGWVILHTAAAAIFSYRLARLWFKSEAAAACAALLVSFNGFFMAHAAYPNLFGAAALLPAVLYFHGTNSWRGLGAALALQWLAGYPPFFILTLLALVVLSLVRKQGAFSVLAKGGMLSMALAAFHVIPFLELVRHSTRSLLLPASMILEFSIRWQDLLKELMLPQWIWWSPHVGGDAVVLNFYVGIVAVILAGVGVVKGGKRIRWLGLAALVTFILCLGKAVPGYSQLAFLQVFRFPATWLFLATATVIFLAASGMSRISSRHVQRVLTGLLTLDLLAFAQCPVIAWFDPLFLSQAPPLAIDVRAFPAPSRIFHTHAVEELWLQSPLVSPEDYARMKNVLLPSLGAAYGIHELSSYQVLRLKRAQAFLDRLRREGPDSPCLQWAGVSTVITLRRGAHRIDDESLITLNMKEFEHPLFIAEKGIAAKIVPKTYEPGNVRSVVFVEKPATLVFSEVHYPGWRAFIDDQPVSHGAFEKTFLSVDVPAGPHWVQFVYRPDSFRVGMAISLVTFFMWCAFLVWDLRQRIFQIIP